MKKLLPYDNVVFYITFVPFILLFAIFLYSCAANQSGKPHNTVSNFEEQAKSAEFLSEEEFSEAETYENVEQAERDGSWGLGTKDENDTAKILFASGQTQKYSSATLGYQWQTADTIWHNWDGIAAINQDPDLVLVNASEDLGFFVYGVLIDMSFLSAEDVFNAMLMRHGILPNEKNISIKKRNLNSQIDNSGNSGSIWDFDLTFVTGGIDFNCKGKFFLGNGRAIMAISQTQGILYNKLKNNMEKSVNGISLLEDFDKKGNLKIKKFSARIVNQIGLLRLTEDKPIEALSYFERANSMDKSDTVYLMNCGFIYQLRNLYGPGTAHFESQIDLVKTSGRLLAILGEMYESLYKFDKAKEYAELALQKMPNDEELIINLSDALWGLGQRNASFELAQKTYEKQPSARLGVYTAKTMMGLNRYAEAVDLLLAVKKQFGEKNMTKKESENLSLALTDALLFLNRYEEALAESEEFLQQNPKNADLQLAKGKSLFYLRNYKGAETALNKALALKPDNEDIKSFLSASKAFLGKADTRAILKNIDPADSPSPSAFLQKTAFAESDISERYPAFAHLIQETVKIAPRNPWVRTNTMFLQILNASGAQLFSEFTLDFLPGIDRVYINNLDIYDSSMKLKSSWNPKNAYITYATSQGHKNEAQIVHLPLQNLAVGDFIFLRTSRASIKADESIPYIHYQFSKNYPVAKSILRVYADTSKILTEDYGDPQKNILENEQGETVGIEWEAENPVTIHKEPYMPSYRDFGAGVVVSAKNPWSEVGEKYQNLIKAQYKNSIPVREQAFEAAGTKRKGDAIFAISDWVRSRIKYNKDGFGGHSLIPKTALETLQEKQGDCKDQSLLLQEMLSAIGVKSYLALINLDEVGSEALPSIQQFNHEILYIPATVENPELWLDPSDKVSSARPIPLDLEGRVALVINGDSSYSTITPILEKEQEHEAFLFHRLRLDSQGNGNFRDSLVFTGKFASGIRNELLQRDLKEQREYFLKYLTQTLSKADLITFSAENVTDFSKPLILILTYSSPQYSPYPAIWERSLMRLPAVSERRHPIRIPHETKFHYSLTVTAPSGETAKISAMQTEPKNLFVEVFKSPNESNPKCEGQTCSFELEWKTDAIYAEPSEYDAIRNEWESILEMASPEVK